MIEDQLRETFARHELLAPPAAPLRDAIDRVVVRRRRRRFANRVAGAALAVAAAVSAPFALSNAVDAPRIDTSILPGGAPAVTSPLTLLVLGVDEDGGHSYRADTVLVVHVPADSTTAYLVSLPRDLLVEIPDKGRARLSESFYFGSVRRGGSPDLAAGAALTARTVTAATGLPVDGTVTVKFEGLRAATDALGGVDLCLDRAVTSRHTGRVFPAGCQRLDGGAALDLLRQRYGLPYGAYDRDANGRSFVRGLLAKKEVLADPVRLTRLARAVSSGVTVAGGDLTTAQLLGVATGIEAVTSLDIGSVYRGVEVAGVQYERLDEARSAPVFAAIREDRLAAWVAANPQAVR